MTFKHTKKWYFWAKVLSKIAGYIMCVCPALIATIINFPLMVTENVESTISIPFVIAIMISLAVVLQAVLKAFKNNALIAVVVVLAFITAVFICVYHMEQTTIKGLAWVSGCGAVGVMIACGCFKLHSVWDDLYKHCGEVYVK
jgi:hypothetical protein